MKPSILPCVSIVIIGRNEGERLVACLESIAAMDRRELDVEVIYVDSDSSDGSPDRARAFGAQVISVHPERPSAALGRNAGWRAARGELVMFLDGDTLLHPQFIRRAMPLFADPGVAIVWGHRRERFPCASVYNRVLDLDWIYPAGESAFCGGDALVRRAVLETVQGFDDRLIAGEEPEMCRRIRAVGKRIVHVDLPMTLHDLAIRHFAAYWRRAFRAGHAYAAVSARFVGSDDPLWQREVRRNLMHGGGLIVWLGMMPVLGLMATPWSIGMLLAGLLAAVIVVLRSTWRSAWKSDVLSTRLLYALHSHFQQIPILFGQLAQRRDAHRGRQRRLIEYKSPLSRR